jgi:hypothetical protein
LERKKDGEDEYGVEGRRTKEGYMEKLDKEVKAEIKGEAEVEEEDEDILEVEECKEKIAA